MNGPSAGALGPCGTGQGMLCASRDGGARQRLHKCCQDVDRKVIPTLERTPAWEAGAEAARPGSRREMGPTSLLGGAWLPQWGSSRDHSPGPSSPAQCFPLSRSLSLSPSSCPHQTASLPRALTTNHHEAAGRQAGCWAVSWLKRPGALQLWSPIDSKVNPFLQGRGMSWTETLNEQRPD